MREHDTKVWKEMFFNEMENEQVIKRMKNDRRNGEKLVATSVEKRKDGKKK